GRRSRLAQEPLDPLGRFEHARIGNLEGHIAVEVRVAGLVDSAEGADAEAAEHHEPPQSLRARRGKLGGGDVLFWRAGSVSDRSVGVRGFLGRKLFGAWRKRLFADGAANGSAGETVRNAIGTRTSRRRAVGQNRHRTLAIERDTSLLPEASRSCNQCRASLRSGERGRQPPDSGHRWSIISVANAHP